jgi:hypothetical protein
MSIAVRHRTTSRSWLSIATVAVAVAAAASFYIGERWLFAHVERPIGEQLCGTGCSYAGEPRNVLIPVASAVVALLTVGVLAVTAGRWRMNRSKIRGGALDLILTSGVLFVAAIAIIGKRSDGFKLSIDSTGSQPVAPGSAAWIVLGLALTAIAIGLRHRAQRSGAAAGRR